MEYVGGFHCTTRIYKINLQALDAKMEQLQAEFSKMFAEQQKLAEQQKQMMAQFQVPYFG
jgi:hypothetical protein